MHVRGSLDASWDLASVTRAFAQVVRHAYRELAPMELCHLCFNQQALSIDLQILAQQHQLIRMLLVPGIGGLVAA